MGEPVFFPPARLQENEIVLLRSRVKSLCHFVRAAAFVWAAWQLLLILWIWLRADENISQFAAAFEIDPALITRSGYWMAFALALVDEVFSIAFAVAVWRLMGGYLRGDIFSVTAAERLRAVALVGLAAILATVVLRVLQAALITTAIFAKAPIWFWIDPVNLLYAMCCGFFLALAAVFQAVAEIADEHSQFV